AETKLYFTNQEISDTLECEREFTSSRDWSVSEKSKTIIAQWAKMLICDFILLHVFPLTRSRNNNKQRSLRLKGFQLALSFKDLCDEVPDAKVEIVVREGDQDGRTIASTISEVSASDLVLGLHDQSFCQSYIQMCYEFHF
ncbi:hypothetical protein IFM89_014147, partial [Coptis chinensis]